MELVLVDEIVRNAIFDPTNEEAVYDLMSHYENNLKSNVAVEFDVVDEQKAC